MSLCVCRICSRRPRQEHNERKGSEARDQAQAIPRRAGKADQMAYRSFNQRRRNRIHSEIVGIAACAALIAATGLAFVAAYQADKARGVSVDASLASAGIGNSRAARWQIVHTDAAGNLYVDDYGMSLLDCIRDASAMNRATERGRFQCERES